jgi:hypothetical protein
VFRRAAKAQQSLFLLAACSRTNQEINDILKGQNIIGFIKKTKIILVRPS